MRSRHPFARHGNRNFLAQRPLILDFSNNTNATSETNYDNVQFLPLKDLLLGAGYHVAALLAPAGDGAMDNWDLKVPPKKIFGNVQPPRRRPSPPKVDQSQVYTW